MSRTFRRTNVGTSVAESYMVDPNNLVVVDGKLKEMYLGRGRGQTPDVYAEKTNFRFFSDNYEGSSAPKMFRRMINRSERRRVRQEIIKTLRDDTLDGFVDTRMKLPYWD